MKLTAWKIFSTLIAASFIATSCTSDAGDDNPPATTTQDGNSQVVAFPNKIDTGRTEYRDARLPANTPGQANPECEYPADRTLRIGSLIPRTGALDGLAPVQEAAIELALADIEAAGGITGMDLTYDVADSGDNDTALVSAQRHIDEGVDVVLGPPSSVLSQQVIGEITSQCRIHISAANTAMGFDALEQNDLYFRTAPSDRLQGHALASLVAESGPSNVAIIAATGDYGDPLGNFTSAALGLANIASSVTPYDPNDVDSNAVAEQATRGDPDAFILIGFEESSKILAELLRRDVDPRSIYLSDGNAGDALGTNFTDADELDGIRGIRPGAETSGTFKRRLNQTNSQIDDFSFGPETYDAIIVTALAAELAQSDSPPAIARQINGVTRDGTLCTSYTQCKNLIVGGETDIDYDGFSGPLRFDADGEVTEASFAVVEFG